MQSVSQSVSQSLTPMWWRHPLQCCFGADCMQVGQMRQLMASEVGLDCVRNLVLFTRDGKHITDDKKTFGELGFRDNTRLTISKVAARPSACPHATSRGVRPPAGSVRGTL